MADALDRLDRTVAQSANAVVGTRAIRVGVDLVEIARIETALGRSAFAERCFTEAEREYCDAAANSAERYAVRFSAKEAVLKALGVGLGGVGWHDMEVTRLPSGEPQIRVSGRGLELGHELGIQSWLITMTHSKTTAHAMVVGLGSDPTS